jgi:hypothetical protein
LIDHERKKVFEDLLAITGKTCKIVSDE